MWITAVALGVMLVMKANLPGKDKVIWNVEMGRVIKISMTNLKQHPTKFDFSSQVGGVCNEDTPLNPLASKYGVKITLPIQEVKYA